MAEAVKQEVPGPWLYLDNGVVFLNDAIKRLSADAEGEPVYSYQQDIPPMAAGLRCREKLNDLTVVSKFFSNIAAAPETAAERDRLREEVRVLREVLSGVESRCQATGGYVGQDGQYMKVIRAALARA